MFSCLLKRAIPFTLTFILGATIGGFFKMFRSNESKSVGMFMPYRTYEYNYGRGCDHRRKLLAESKSVIILFKPDAKWPRGLPATTGNDESAPALVRVNFGADGKVHEVKVVGEMRDAVRDAIENAARRIQFEPETINSIPVSITKDVEIRFMSN